MTQPPNEWGDYQLRNKSRITTEAWLVLAGAGKRPKVWSSFMLRPSSCGEKWRRFARVRKGRGYRYNGLWVCQMSILDRTISIEATFATEELAVQFMIAQAREYLP